MNVIINGRRRHFRTVTFDRECNSVILIDQRRLPHEFVLAATRDYLETAHAISEMWVRGAPAIAATAAYGVAQGALSFRRGSLRLFQSHVQKVQDAIQSARPTAVDPANAMAFVRSAMASGQTVAEQQALALAAAEEFANASVEQCRAIGRHGMKLIRSGMRILTHCNAGWLACVDIGTATAPIYAAHADGRQFHVFCDETRPRLQGASLTAWELRQQGIPHNIIADSAAGHLMQRGEIDLVIVGSDRTLGRTGEVANKIGTYTLAVLAHRHRIPFYVALPLSTLDWTLKSGAQIPIEERSADEVLVATGRLLARRKNGGWKPEKQIIMGQVRLANPGSTARNPAFDVTPPELVTGLITPAGIFKPTELWKNRSQLMGKAQGIASAGCALH